MATTNYKEDRNFTDRIGHEAALKHIYPKMCWEVINPDSIEGHELSETKDMYRSIDYEAYDKNRNIISIQERFRKPGNGGNDFTLRYKREESEEETEIHSEFFKMKKEIRKNPNKEFYLIYGILANDKDLEKYVVINLNDLFKEILAGNIVINETDKNAKISRIENDKMLVPVRYNTDKSSSFVAFVVGILEDNYSSIIAIQYGFKNSKNKDAFVTEKQISYLRFLSNKKRIGLNYNIEYMSKNEATKLIQFLLSDLSDSDDIKALIHDTETIKIVSKYLKWYYKK